MWRLSFKLKLGIGAFCSYTSLELFLLLRSKYTIYQREQEPLVQGVDEVTKYRSATVAGMFINPFKEYRPQTAFEFLLVRVIEVIESFYGNKIEKNEGILIPNEDTNLLNETFKSFKPKLEMLKKNSVILKECIQLNDFRSLYASPNQRWFTKSTLPPLRDQMIFQWLGQSCSLIQISGINFLTDPLLGDHLFLKRLGPKRLVDSPLDLNEIKYATDDNLNFTLVSHDHPDHFEVLVAKEIGNSTTWIVPLGLRKKLGKLGIHKVIEMDWWDTVSLTEYITPSESFSDKYEVVCLPAMHWSGRYVLDSNKSLWCSFLIRRNGESVLYHAGDTGYQKELFSLIGRKYGPVFLSLLPIGQYCPSWHQKPRHISPEESVQICSHISSLFMQGVHWGTFKLSSEPIVEPKMRLTEKAKQLGKSSYYGVPRLGLTYLYDLGKGTQIELKA